MKDKWKLLVSQCRNMIQGTHPLSALCNILALVWWSDESINWAGLYLKDGNSWILGPFQGKPACLLIPAGKGVVGTCGKIKEPILVPDVHAFAGHIACDSESRSEYVFPLMDGETVLAVLDIDCLKTAGISEEMEEAFCQIGQLLESVIRMIPDLGFRNRPSV